MNNLWIVPIWRIFFLVLGLTNYSYSYLYRSWLRKYIPISICDKNNYSLITDLKGQKIALLVQKFCQYCWMGGFCLLVELHRERICAFSLRGRLVYEQLESHLEKYQLFSSASLRFRHVCKSVQTFTFSQLRGKFSCKLVFLVERKFMCLQLAYLSCTCHWPICPGTWAGPWPICP